MPQLRRALEEPFRTSDQTYQVSLVGNSRPDGMWEGRLSFKPAGRGGVTLKTPVETTQSNERALVHWAQALSTTFFEGAFKRALATVDAKSKPPSRKAIASSTDVDPKRVEKSVLDCFRKFKTVTLNRQTFLETIDEFSNADVVRAIESLERQGLVTRVTDRGSLWVTLLK